MASFRDVVPRGLIVSCQAAPGDPLYGAPLMARMAVAAERGGAVAIRAEGAEDVAAIRAAVRLPVIGLRKRVYPGSAVLITPTFAEAREVAEAGAGVVALDATDRPRPGGETLAGLIARIHLELQVPVVADVASLEDASRAAAAGADAVASTLAGHVGGEPAAAGPDVEMVRRLAASLSIPILAEGGYRVAAEAELAIAAGAYAVVVGTAITRPEVITAEFAEGIARRLGG